MRRARAIEVTKVQAQAIEHHVMRGAAAQLAVDQLLEQCHCGHVRAAHVKSGVCCEPSCRCVRFGKAVR